MKIVIRLDSGNVMIFQEEYQDDNKITYGGEVEGSFFRVLKKYYRKRMGEDGEYWDRERSEYLYYPESRIAAVSVEYK